VGGFVAETKLQKILTKRKEVLAQLTATSVARPPI
jgi:hypothetical protein